MATHEKCPGDELLVAYLTTGLNAGEQGEIDQHLRVCDRCVEGMVVARRRIALETEITAPVPLAVRERVRARQDSALTTRHAHPTWLSALRDWLSWVPAWVPVAVAASVMLVVASNPTWLHPRPNLTRSIQLPETLRVTANNVQVRRQPSLHAEVVMTLPRGATVTVRGEDRDWYHVASSNGEEGWVEREAFE